MAAPKRPPVWRFAFLRALGRSGNVRAAAHAAGISARCTYGVRKIDPRFAAIWARAVATARARVMRGAVVLGPGEVIGTSKTGPCVRRAGWNRWDAARRETFLLTLAATGNVTRAANACRLAPTTLYTRRRADPALARDWDAALAEATPRLRAALSAAANASWDPYGTVDGAAAAIPELPPVTFAEGLNLLKWLERERRGQAPPPAMLSDAALCDIIEAALSLATDEGATDAGATDAGDGDAGDGDAADAA